MIGTVESILYDGDLVRSVEVRLPSRDSPQGRLLSLRLKERLGNGSFGMVYYGCCDEYPKLAVKISTGKNKRLKEELEVLSKVCTKGKLLLPRFEFGAINKTGDLIAIGMELCVPSTLHDLLIAEPLTQEADMLFIAHQVVKAVSYVHEHHCIHRDVKLKNFVFDLDGNLKLIDFGLASPVWQPPPGDLVAGTISFMAPEMAHNALNRDERVSVGAAADVWSVGIVLFSIFAQGVPYSLRDTNEKPGDACDSDSGDEGHGVPYSKELPMLKVNFQLLRRVAAGDWRWPDNCDISPALRNLVEFVLVADQHKRPSITDVLNRPEWEARRRATPLVVLRFLGVEDDFLLSHDEAHLLRAVEQRGADVNASSSCEQTKLSGEDTSEDAQRASLKFVAREEVSVGGIPTHQVYDMRPDPRRKRPIREISVVLAEENARSLGRSRSRSSRAAMMSTSRGASHRVTRSKTVTPVPQTPEAVKNGDETPAESDSSSVIFIGSGQGGGGLAGTHKSGTKVEGNVGHGGEILTDTTTLPTSLSAVSDLVTHSEELRGAAVLGSTRPDKNRGGSPFGLRSNGKQPAVRENPAKGASTRVLKRSKASRTEDAEEIADVTNLRSLVAMERSVRRFLAARLLLESLCLVKGVRFMWDEMIDWDHMVWLEKEQRKSALHPHKFVAIHSANKTYALGFICDICCYEFLPDGPKTFFFHCACGRDLCYTCHGQYVEECTCTKCNSVFDNGQALHNHRALCGKKGTRSSKVTTPVKARSSVDSRPRVTATDRKVKGATPKKSSNRGNGCVSTSAPSAPLLRRPSVALLENAGVATRKRPPQRSESNRKAPSPPLQFKKLEPLPEGKWMPLERLSISRRAFQPTPEERELILNSDWIRYYHFYPMEPDEGESIGVTYRIQPGRTAITFFNYNYSVHSAIMSKLERFVCFVDNVNLLEDDDTVRIVPMGQAKCTAEEVYNILQAVDTYDCSMLKQRRSPGVMSIYQPPQTALRCYGDPYIFVRWHRFNLETSLSVFMLSNGAIQVFIGEQYELRWFDENRKFILRSNGVCEVLDESTFPLSESINHLLYSAI